MNNLGEAQRILEALALCNDELRAFAYSLYIQHQRIGRKVSWSQSFQVSGTRCFFGSVENNGYQRCLIPTTMFQVSSAVCLDFSIYFCYNNHSWMVHADVDLNDSNQDDANYSTCLWNFPEKRTPDIDEAIALLQIATQKVIDYGKTEDFSYLFNKEENTA